MAPSCGLGSNGRRGSGRDPRFPTARALRRRHGRPEVADERRIVELVAEGGSLSAIRFEDGAELARAGLLVGAPMRQGSDLPAQLGATASDPTPMAADPLEVDAMGRTTVVQSLLAEDHDLPMPG